MDGCPSGRSPGVLSTLGPAVYHNAVNAQTACQYYGISMDRLRKIARISAASLIQTVIFIVSLWSIFYNIATHFNKIRRSHAVLLAENGGHGFTLYAPDWFRRLFPDGPVLIFYGTTYEKARHNPLVSNLWCPNHFIWVRQGLTFSGGQTVYYNPAYIHLSFTLAATFLRLLFPAKHIVLHVPDLVHRSPLPENLDQESEGVRRLFTEDLPESYEGPLYYTFATRPAPPIHVPSALKEHVEKQLQIQSDHIFTRRCNLFLRNRPHSDESSSNRQSGRLESYRGSIQELIKRDYQVLLTGDFDVSDDMINAFPGSIVDAKALGLDWESFSLYAGFEVDIHIGCFSGGSAAADINAIPNLMLNAFPPDHSLQRSVNHPKWVYRTDGKLMDLSSMLRGDFRNCYARGNRIEENSATEITTATIEFLENYSNPDYGIDPRSLGIDAPYFQICRGKLSPAWLRAYIQRGGTVHTTRPI